MIMNSLENVTMSDTYVVVEGVAYYEKDGNYYTASVNADNTVDWKHATKIDIKSASGPDIGIVHSIYDSLQFIKSSQRNLLHETRRVAV
jgi:hypothetical protein